MKKILCIIGTRPEAIKMIPVIYALQSISNFNCKIISTAQHRNMLDQVFNLFNIKADVDLDIMKPNQSLNMLAGRMMIALEDVLKNEKPDAVLAQGDTTTVMTAALSAFHQQIPFGHVEAGLRTKNRYSPFPEEMNRMLAGRIAEWHFAPTEIAKNNLYAEGISPHQIFLTGNTIVDMVKMIHDENISLPFSLDTSKKLILVTAHRRENFGKPLHDIFTAIKKIADQFDDIQILYPVHPNPNVKPIAEEMLKNHPRIFLCQPLDYISFLNLMKKCFFIMSDSGGIQEEALALGKPVLLLRNDTERPEGIELGGVIQVGHNQKSIFDHAKLLLTDDKSYQRAAHCASPYGDGTAATKIVAILRNYFSA